MTRSLSGVLLAGLAVMTVACSSTVEEPPSVLLDPWALDLGGVYPTQETERKLTVVDLSALPGSTLEQVSVEGNGSDWVTVRPVVPLPADLSSPVPIEVALSLPFEAGPGSYTLRLTARGALGDEAFVREVPVTFDVENCDVDRDGDRVPACGGQDCDDEDPAINGFATELCNGIDDDCNNIIDDSPDVDGDGFGLCVDCDDADPQVRPGALERCNGQDDDCDGFVDIGEVDGDGDGVAACEGDCNELDASIFPGAVERCNGLDDDCDGVPDDLEDSDGDTFTVCEDCADTDRFIYPGAPERCNGIDDDCDGELPASEVDADGDGVPICGRDCDDDEPRTYPGNVESCDGLDNDCNSEIDEGSACPCDRVADGSNVYLFCDTDETWAAARTTCGGWGYHLITIDDALEDEFAFEEVLRVDDTRKWWMGYTDQRVEGRWVWEDGTPSGYENWGSGEPNDAGAGEDCAQLNRYEDGRWNDEPCGSAFPYVCELE